MGIELVLPDEYATETLLIPCRPNIVHASLDHDRKKHAKHRELVPDKIPAIIIHTYAHEMLC
jgi:hypothetical protein